jgi:organic radical activating enzyme
MPTLEITTMIGCPVMCTFCPQDNLRHGMEKEDKYLSLDNFKLILNKVPKHVRIDFSGMSEPWVNKDCTAMVQFALERGFDIAIYTTLYGLDEEGASELIELLKKHLGQVKELVVHLQDKNNNMKGLKLNENWIAVANKFIEFYNLHVLSQFRFMTMDESAQLHVTDRLMDPNRDHLMDPLWDRPMDPFRDRLMDPPQDRLMDPL